MGILPKYKAGDTAMWRGHQVSIRGICLRGDNIIDAINRTIGLELLNNLGLFTVDNNHDRYIVQFDRGVNGVRVEKFDREASGT